MPEPENYIFHGHSGVDLIPANSQLFVLERKLSSVDFREYKLSEYVNTMIMSTETCESRLALTEVYQKLGEDEKQMADGMPLLDGEQIVIMRYPA